VLKMTESRASTPFRAVAAYADRTTLRQRANRWRNRDPGLGADSATALNEPGDPNLDLSIVVPFFNTGRALLTETLAGIRDKLAQAEIRFEVIAVDDGGSDDSFGAVADLGDPRVRLIRLAQNQGKGGALLNGFIDARSNWIGFIDADGDISPDHLTEYLATAVASDSDMVVADKTHQESSNFVEASRAATSQVMHLVNGRLLRLALTDTQTGAKIFRRELLAHAVPLARERGFALDVELFVLARILRYRRILGMPVSIERTGGSTVSKKTVIKTGGRVLRIWAREQLGMYRAEPRTWGDHAAEGVRLSASGVGYEMVAESAEHGRRSGGDRRGRAIPGLSRDRRSLRDRRDDQRAAAAI
jgi:hypothetical protein